MCLWDHQPLQLHHSSRQRSTEQLCVVSCASNAFWLFPLCRTSSASSFFSVCCCCVCVAPVVCVCVCHKDSLAYFLEVLIINFPWCLSAPVWLIHPWWVCAPSANVEQTIEEHLPPQSLPPSCWLICTTGHVLTNAWVQRSRKKYILKIISFPPSSPENLSSSVRDFLENLSAKVFRSPAANSAVVDYKLTRCPIWIRLDLGEKCSHLPHEMVNCSEVMIWCTGAVTKLLCLSYQACIRLQWLGIFIYLLSQIIIHLFPFFFNIWPISCLFIYHYQQSVQNIYPSVSIRHSSSSSLIDLLITGQMCFCSFSVFFFLPLSVGKGYPEKTFPSGSLTFPYFIHILFPKVYKEVWIRKYLFVHTEIENLEKPQMFFFFF